MSFLDKLFGKDSNEPTPPPRQTAPAMSADEEAIARYRYMLRTAPPEDLERAHAEAFERLTPEQRRQVLEEISSRVPEFERPRSDDPHDLARAATRAEVREPGFMERNFRGGGMGMGMGGMMMGGLFSSLAGAFIGSAIAHQFFDNPSHAEGFAAENNLAPDQGSMDAGNYAYADAPAVEAPGADAYEQDPMGDPGADLGGDFGGDLGGDFGDI